MRDRFFEVENCDRCKKPLNGCRIQSMYSSAVLCMECHDKETKRSDFRRLSQQTTLPSGMETIISPASDGKSKNIKHQFRQSRFLIFQDRPFLFITP